jgi:hypothetical protein
MEGERMSTEVSVLDKLVAAEEIRNLSARYALALDEYDMEKLLEPWLEDAVFDASVFELGTYAGHDAMRGFFQHNFDVMKDQAHLFTNFLIEVNGPNSASGSNYLYEEGHDLEGNAVSVVCLNRDRYLRVDGEWMIAERVIAGLVTPQLDTYRASL